MRPELADAIRNRVHACVQRSTYFPPEMVGAIDRALENVHLFTQCQLTPVAGADYHNGDPLCQGPNRFMD